MIVLNMIIDGMIVRLANGVNLLPKQCVLDAENLIKTIVKRTATKRSTSVIKSKLNLTIMYPRTSITCNIADLCYRLHKNEEIDSKLVENIISIKNNAISSEIAHSILRALLLCDEKLIKHDLWLKLWVHLLSGIENDTKKSIDMIYLVLYLLSNKTDGKKQLVLLQGLTAFSLIKVN